MKQDSEIQKDVMDELKWEPILNAAEIGVSVKNGVVTLSGSVNSYPVKLAAENAAARISGVKAVAEDIEVRPPHPLTLNDTEIAQAVTAALRWNYSVNHEDVKIKVDNGWLTLSGRVDWEFQKKAVEHAVRDIKGIRGVSNLITLTPKVKKEDILQQINSAFHRSANIDAKKIYVTATGSKITLTGKVRSLAEKNDAAKAVWAAEGVTDVENNLEVDFALAYAAY